MVSTHVKFQRFSRIWCKPGSSGLGPRVTFDTAPGLNAALVSSLWKPAPGFSNYHKILGRKWRYNGMSCQASDFSELFLLQLTKRLKKKHGHRNGEEFQVSTDKADHTYSWCWSSHLDVDYVFKSHSWIRNYRWWTTCLASLAIFPGSVGISVARARLLLPILLKDVRFQIWMCAKWHPPSLSSIHIEPRIAPSIVIIALKSILGFVDMRTCTSHLFRIFLATLSIDRAHASSSCALRGLVFHTALDSVG